MTKLNSLELAATAFSHWRNSRASSNERIPITLREQALTLLEQYSKAQVINALGINHSTLKRWQSSGESPDADFVALPDIPMTSLNSEMFSALKITLIHPAGTEMCISGDITPTQLHCLAESFLGFQGGKS